MSLSTRTLTRCCSAAFSVLVASLIVLAASSCRPVTSQKTRTRSVREGTAPTYPAGRPLKLLNGRFKLNYQGRSGKTYPVHMSFVLALDTAQKAGTFSAGVVSDGGYNAMREGDYIDGDDELSLSRAATPSGTASSTGNTRTAAASTARETDSGQSNSGTPASATTGPRSSSLAGEPEATGTKSPGSQTGDASATKPESGDGAGENCTECTLVFTGQDPTSKAALQVTLQFGQEGRWRVTQLNYFGQEASVTDDDAVSFWK